MARIGASGTAPAAAYPSTDIKTNFALPLAFMLVATPVLVHGASPTVGLLLCVLVGIVAANFAAPIVPVLLTTAFLFQNMFVAMVSPAITTTEEFNLIRGHNFVLLLTVWAVSMLAMFVAGPRLVLRDRVFLFSACLLPLIGIYMVIGFGKGFEGAPAYLRNIVGPVMCLQVGLVAALLGGSRPERALIALGWLAVAFGYLQFAFGLDFLALFNGDVYMNARMQELMQTGYWQDELKQTGFVVRDPLDIMRITLFNTPLLAGLDFTVLRLQGPNFHPISYGYAVAILSLIALACGHVLLLIFALPILFIVGSKGAIILLVVVGAAMSIAPRWRSPYFLVLVVVGLAALMTVAFVVGLSHGDYHVLGLIGSVKGFLENPIGHGLGGGGNLTGMLSRADWQNAQAAGQTTVAVESAVGVMLYQMGIAAIPLLAFYAWLVWHCWRSYLATSAPLLAFSALTIATLLANGVLQEEAMFAPLAFGMALLIAGIALGRTLVHPSSS